jgi:hypothetical protein
MRHRTVFLLVILVAGCPGGDAGIGETCARHGDCDGTLQCTGSVCVPRCERGPDCGDGYSCDGDGLCQLATGQPGDGCTSEIDCAPGLSCQIDGQALDNTGHLLASCTAQNAARPPGATCALDTDCRNGTCALGQCVDLCSETRDCATGRSCMVIPRVEASGSPFHGCLPAQGNIVWSIPNSTPLATFLLPVPSGAHSASVVFSVDDLAQRVGAQSVYSPSGVPLYVPCSVTQDQDCDPVSDFFKHTLRHQPLFGQSVIALPSTPSVPLETGAYRVHMSSYRPNGTTGSAIPRVTAVVRIDSAVLLDLHFNFLNLEDHMCESTFGNAQLNAGVAQVETFFQNDFLGELQTIFARGGIALGAITYRDMLDHPDLDGLDITDAGSLLELGDSPTGINVFFVRTLSPVGLLAIGPNPGPAGLANTRQSGIIISLDTLCYRSWSQLARITAHELARYMGLHHNVELGATTDQDWRDKIDDTDDSENNLMFFSEFGGVDITPGQRDILTRSGVLR